MGLGHRFSRIEINCVALVNFTVRHSFGLPGTLRLGRTCERKAKHFSKLKFQSKTLPILFVWKKLDRGEFGQAVNHPKRVLRFTQFTNKTRKFDLKNFVFSRWKKYFRINIIKEDRQVRMCFLILLSSSVSRFYLSLKYHQLMKTVMSFPLKNSFALRKKVRG